MNSVSENEVKTVTAVIEPAGKTDTADLIISAPPAACTVKNFGFNSETDSTAPLTVFGIS